MSDNTITVGELKPCPFCGCEASLGWIESKNRAGGLYIVECTECEASGAPVRTLYQVMTELDEEYCPHCGKEINKKRKCRVCGCTQERACPGGCWWVEYDLCSACVGKEQ